MITLNNRIGSYERNEVLPSIEVAAKIGAVLKVSLDYLPGNSKKAAVDKKTMNLIPDIEDLEPSIKDKLIFLANTVIRDVKTGKAYYHQNNKARQCRAYSVYNSKFLFS